MKTTLSIDDTVMAQLKREAARQGRTMSELVESALRRLFHPTKERRAIRPLPTFRGGGALVDIADRDALYQAMEGRQLFVVDTNVLVYAADSDSPQHGRCRELLEGWRRQAAAWYLTWGIVYEFLRVTTHPRVFRSPWSARKAWTFIEAVLDAPALAILIPTERHSTVAAEVITLVPDLAGNLMHDMTTAALMREHGIRRIYTRDTDFHRFPFLEPQDPMTA